MENNSVNKTIAIIRIKSLLYRILGLIIAIFCGLFAIVGTTQIAEALDVFLVILFIIFTALGIKLFLSGKNKAKLLSKFNFYSSRLASDPQKSLNILASEINVPISELIKDINKMIVLGLFPDSFIDAKSGCLIIPDCDANSPENRYAGMQSSSLGEPEYITVKCKNCGATNKLVKGSVGECEFCGSQISQ